MALYEVYVLTTSDFKANEEGETVSGKRKEFRAAKQARKFIPDWLLKQRFDPSSGAAVVAIRAGADGKPLSAQLALEYQDIEDLELAQKRNLTLVKATNAKAGVQWVKPYGMLKVAAAGGGPLVWGVQEIKPEPVKAEAAKK